MGTPLSRGRAVATAHKTAIFRITGNLKDLSIEYLNSEMCRVFKGLFQNRGTGVPPVVKLEETHGRDAHATRF